MDEPLHFPRSVDDSRQSFIDWQHKFGEMRIISGTADHDCLGVCRFFLDWSMM